MMIGRTVDRARRFFASDRYRKQVCADAGNWVVIFLLLLVVWSLVP